MKVSFNGKLFKAWEEYNCIILEVHGLEAPVITYNLNKMQDKQVRVTVEEIPDNEVPISTILEMANA